MISGPEPARITLTIVPDPTTGNRDTSSKIWPGKIIKVKASGGYDIDYLFPTRESSLYAGCPGACPISDCIDRNVCELAISNINRPYEWVVSGYIDTTEGEGYYVNPNDSSECYIAVNSDYPFGVATPKIYITVDREGASEAEYAVTPSGPYILTENKSHSGLTLDVQHPEIRSLNFIINLDYFIII